MTPTIDNKLIRIGVFYDGNYFAHVSNYYNYEHERKARLSISGLHDFIRKQASDAENVDRRFCQITDAHYFRGRLSSFEAQERNRLLSERMFDDILMSEGVVTHYLPLRSKDGRISEKGIDVWLALEAFELAIHKKFNVVVLVACDSDYLPLVRKLNTLGVRVMILGWDFEYEDERTGRIRKTVTSLELMQEASYPISMHEIIDNKIYKNESLVNNLFVQKDSRYQNTTPYAVAAPTPTPGVYSGSTPATSNGSAVSTFDDSKRYTSTVFSLKNGYGFIDMPPNNLYFHWTGLEGGEFNELEIGDEVEFAIGKNNRGQDIAIKVRKLDWIDEEEEGVIYEDYEEEIIYEDEDLEDEGLEEEILEEEDLEEEYED